MYLVIYNFPAKHIGRRNFYRQIKRRNDCEWISRSVIMTENLKAAREIAEQAIAAGAYDEKVMILKAEIID